MPARPLLVDRTRPGNTPSDIYRVILRNGIAAVRDADMHAPV
ncbi:hypothetical protein [Actinomadura physcomitrii]|nr:hypothetical protein [Actinomadura physcomitrii]